VGTVDVVGPVPGLDVEAPAEGDDEAPVLGPVVSDGAVVGAPALEPLVVPPEALAAGPPAVLLTLPEAEEAPALPVLPPVVGSVVAVVDVLVVVVVLVAVVELEPWAP
jgi:hypothetical protein